MKLSIPDFGDRWTPPQRKLALFTLLSFFCLGLPRVVTNATAFALFLDTFDASLLPWTYLGAAIAAPAVGAAYLWLQRRMSFWSLVLTALWFDIAVLSVVRAGLSLGVARPLVMALTIWVEVEWLIAGLVFWGLAERLFDIRESKRLFGIIGAGEPAAVIVGGLLVSLLLRVLPTQDLIVVSMAAMGTSAALILVIRRRYAGDLHQDAGDEEDRDAPRKPFGRYQGYVTLIFALTFVAEVAHFLADNAFYGVAELRYAGPASLASFIALFFAGSGVLNLLFSLVLSAYVLRRFGLGAAILSLPLLVGTAALLAMIASRLPHGASWFFALVCAAKLFDEAVRNGVYSAGFLTLFQPLPPDLRTRAHAISGSYFEQIGAGVAGVALLALNVAVGFSPLVLVVTLVLVCIAWAALGGVQVRGYRTVLALAFEQRRLGDVPDLHNQETLAAIERRLAAGRPAERMYAMTLLARQAPERLAPSLPALIAHPDADVRSEALAMSSHCATAQIRDVVRERMHGDPAAQVRCAALRALAALDGAAAIDEIAPCLDAQDESVRLAAYVALMRDAGIEGLLEAGPRLMALLRGAEVSANRFAARVLYELASPQFYRLVAECLRSEDAEVRRMGLRTAAHVAMPPLRPLLVDLLRSPRLGQAAILALVPLGDAALTDALALADDGATDGATRVRVATLAGRIGGSRAIHHLVGQVRTGDLDERAAVAAALHATGHEAIAEVDREILWEAVQSTVADLRALDLAPAGGGAVARLMHSSLSEARDRQRIRLLHLLATLLPRSPVGTAIARFRRGTPEDRAYAIELMDTLLPPPRREDVLPVLGDAAGVQAIGLSDLARQLLRTEPVVSSWLRTIARHVLLRPPAGAPAIESIAGTGLHSDRASPHLHETNPAMRPEGGPMLLIEKVILLRAVSIFEQVPDYLLADIAGRLLEVDVIPGQVLMREGDVGDSLYIVVEGRFNVVRGGRVIAALGEGEVIGELALLDPEPRSATVEGVTAGRLLVLGPQDFDDLIAGSKEIAIGFVRMLSRKLRDTSERLSSVRTDA